MKLILSSLATISLIMTLLVNAAMALDPITFAHTTKNDTSGLPEKTR